MLFNSISFLFAFLPVVYVGFWLLKTKNSRFIWLTLSSYIFYGMWNYKFCALMAFSTIVSYLAGLGLMHWEKPRVRKFFLVAPIAIDLLLLGFFKYFNFFAQTITTVSGWVALPGQLSSFDIVLPVGISFYTFHTITYIVDSYRRAVVPTKNIFEFACYVSLFSQLVAGPIVRFRQIEADLENIDRADRRRWLDRGWSFFAIGMMKKVLIADTIARIINPALNEYTRLSTYAAWLCVLGYAYQLYFDFSGYSDMAVGLGYFFGIRLPQNFNSPYKASSITELWHRWHISLSACLRDYLYIPLGGSRGSLWKTYRNLIITMLLGGLWHGASWTFVLFGGYHGLLLCLHKAYAELWSRLPVFIQRTGTFFLFLLGLILFRSDSFVMAWTILVTMFSWRPVMITMSGYSVLIAMLVVAACIAHLAPNTFQIKHEWGPRTVTALAVGYLACLLMIAGGNPTPFLYFQF
jgi:alginate O-acetyltransferase complex protein AlgI